MPNTIRIKRSSTPSAVPASLTAGELAINTADGKLFWANAGSVVQSTSLSGGGSGALTHWTESVSAASPNNTTNACQFLATASSTNATAVLSAKGTGAIAAQVPDNAVAGGAVRGAYATDWQRSRQTSSQVASGQYSVVLGGQYNTASSTASTAGGYNCKATGTYAVAIGSNCTASNSGAVSLGASNTASGLISVALGSSNTASDSRSIAIGELNNASGMWSVAIGYQNNASGVFATAIGSANTVAHQSACLGSSNTTGGEYQTIVGNHVRGSPAESALMFGASYGMAAFTPRTDDRRYSGLLHLGGTTTDSTTAVKLVSNNVTAGSSNQFAIPNYCLAMFRIRVIAKRKLKAPLQGYDCKWWTTTTEGVAHRELESASTLTMPQSIVLSSANQSSWGSAGGSVTVAVNTTTGCVEVSVVGVTTSTAYTQNVQWLAEIEFTFLGMDWT